ncbi:MAG: hypothetical protein FWD34_08825 [Oscillospiraceae bacterium]|nr:hypothetical protein [Oscillospiraceae bacterium]
MKKLLVLFLTIILLLNLTACTDISNPPPEPVVSVSEETVGADDPVRPTTDPEPIHIPVFLPLPHNAPPPSELLHSGGVYMYNVEEDMAVFTLNEFNGLPPASIGKILTMLVVLENVPDLNESVRVTYDAFAAFDSDDPNMEGAAIAYIEVNQTNLTYLDCLYALMLASGCEAGNILAYNAGGGDMDAFVDMMNAFAADIGCVNTNFKNASGLYEVGFYTCAYDMFLITKYAIDNYPIFMEIAIAPEYEMPPNKKFPDGYIIQNTSRGFKDGLATGIKTGSINEYFDLEGTHYDGFITLVSTATDPQTGLTYIIVTMDADFYNEERERSGYHFTDHRMLYEWAFSTFSYQ